MKRYIKSNATPSKRYYIEYYRIFKDGKTSSPDACYMYASNEFDLLDKIHTRFKDTNMYKFAIQYHED